MSLLIALSSFELGCLTTTLARFIGSRHKNRELLISGPAAPKELRIVDTQLKKLVGIPTRVQARVADRLVKVCRWAVNTKAFEYAVLYHLREIWKMLPGKNKELDPEVKLFL